MKIVILRRSSGVSGGEYQSVMMTPPNGSAEASGMKESVSSEARHRKELTPIPPPPPPAPGLLPPPNRLTRSRPPAPRIELLGSGCGSSRELVVGGEVSRPHAASASEARKQQAAMNFGTVDPR